VPTITSPFQNGITLIGGILLFNFSINMKIIVLIFLCGRAVQLVEYCGLRLRIVQFANNFYEGDVVQ
jgi:hypothetical protein